MESQANRTNLGFASPALNQTVTTLPQSSNDSIGSRLVPSGATGAASKADMAAAGTSPLGVSGTKLSEKFVSDIIMS